MQPMRLARNFPLARPGRPAVRGRIIAKNSCRMKGLQQRAFSSRAPACSRHGAVYVQAKMKRTEGSPRIFKGKAFVTRDNIDTDQIIPAEYLTLVPSKAEEYDKLGSYALIGLPDEHYPNKFVDEGSMKTAYSIIIGGQNFGCGSSREHAPVALGAAGSVAVVAESYARIFFRNCIATGELYPVETDVRLCDVIKTGEEVTVDLETNVLTDHTTGKTYSLKSIGDAGPVIDAGGIFDYARKTGMIQKF